MNLFSRTTTAVVTALALAVPAGTVIASAQAAPGATNADAPQQVAKKGKKPKLKLKQSAKYSHVGQPGVKITAVLPKSAKGKVSFSVNGAKAGKAKLKKGKASYTLSSANGPGAYKVTAKYKGAKKSTKIRVYNSAIQLSATAFTISKSNDDTLTELTGSVVFKDTPAKKGWVDIYQDGRNKEGSGSPYYCCMTSVGADGTFTFSEYGFLNKLADKHAPGTYTYQAFYTETPSYAEYIYSTPITVTIVP